MGKILIDAGPLYSISNPNDERNKKTRGLLKSLVEDKIHPLTTDYIIDEAATTLLTRQRGGYRFAVHLLEWIFRPESNIEIEWISKSRFYRAKKIFKIYNKDKFWSFTDCTSYVVMKELKINTAFTFDEHFKQMGFQVL